MIEPIYCIQVEHKSGGSWQMPDQFQQRFPAELIQRFIVDARLIRSRRQYLRIQISPLLPQEIDRCIDNDPSDPCIKGRFVSLIGPDMLKHF